MNEIPQAQFAGWARVEVMGHQTHIGYVKTEAYGTAVLFRVDTPELPDREYVLTEPEWGERAMIPAGSKVQRSGSPGGTALIGSGSIYRIIPCTEEAARLAIEQSTRRALKVIELPPGKALPGVTEQPELRDFTCCDGNPEEGHDPDCQNAEPDDDFVEEAL